MAGTVQAMTRVIGQQMATPVSRGDGTVLPVGMSRDGTMFYGKRISDRAFMVSTDECLTWTYANRLNILSNNTILTAARQLGNGEVVLGFDTSTAAYGSIWLSSRWNPASPTSATWTKVLDTNPRYDGSNHLYFAFNFGSFNEDPLGGPVCVASEYGKQTAGLANPATAAVQNYISVDYARTWTTLTNILNLVSTGSRHGHGVAYDPWWDRIWLTYGDAGSTTFFEIMYSDDWRTLLTGGTPTWQRLDRTAAGAQQSNAGYQSVQIIPLRDCILFSSDDQPNVANLRLARAGYRTPGSLALGPIAGIASGPAVIGEYAAPTSQGGAIICTTQQTTVTAGNSRTAVYYSPDGSRFWQIHKDPTVLSGFSTFQCYGPSSTGSMIFTFNNTTLRSTTIRMPQN